MSIAPAKPEQPDFASHPAGLRGERGALTADASRSWTLPSCYYTDPGIHARELTQIFQRAWTYVGHRTDLPAPGSFFADQIAHQPIAVVRGDDGTIRAFFNVCQHRGHLLLKGRGRLSSGIVCPYHAWTYGFDGALKGAPMTKDVPGFRRRDFPLRELPVAIVAGLVFVNLDPSARPFEAEAPGFEQTILDALPDMPDFVASDRMELAIKANWKIVFDNFSEGYHIPVAHPTLSKLHGGRSRADRSGERYTFFHGTGRTSYDGFEVKPDEPYLTWTLWPHHCLLSLPGSSHLIILRLAPNGPDTCLERADVYAPSGNEPPNLVIVKRLFAEMFNREDIAIVESVHRGLSSFGYDQGRYVVDGKEAWYTESGLHKFHLQVLRALGDTV